MPSPIVHCAANQVHACGIETAPDARGRSMVRATLRSSLRSHISLTVQPAPRVTRAPTPKTASMPAYEVSGADVEKAAIVKDHVQGLYSSHMPIGLSYRESSAYGLIAVGSAATIRAGRVCGLSWFSGLASICWAGAGAVTPEDILGIFFLEQHLVDDRNRRRPTCAKSIPCGVRVAEETVQSYWISTVVSTNVK